MLPLTEELLLGAFVYFAEDGTTIDSDTVAIDSLPDDDPATNWTNVQVGTISQVKITPETSTSTTSTPQATGGYRDTKKVRVTGYMIAMTLNEYNELVHRLTLGKKSAITAGTAFTPFQLGEIKATGWLRIEAKDEAGTSRVKLIDWAEVRITEIPEWKNEFGRPVLEFTILGDNNGGLSTCVVEAAA